MLGVTRAAHLFLLYLLKCCVLCDMRSFVYFRVFVLGWLILVVQSCVYVYISFWSLFEMWWMETFDGSRENSPAVRELTWDSFLTPLGDSCSS